MGINNVTGNTLLESGMFPPCRVATTGAIALSGLQTIDGVALIAGDRVLVWKQADATTNGIYAASTGAWVRTTDASQNTQFFNGMLVAVAIGTVSAGLIYQCTCMDDPVVIGTSLLTFQVQSAINTQSQAATSTTSLTVGTGTQSLAIQAGKNFSANQWVLIYDAASAMLGQITSYTGTALVVAVAATSGSGTHADWSIALTNSSAAAGLMPPLGTGNVTGPGSSTAGHLATFADSTGKVLSDSGVTLGTLASRATLIFGDAGTATIPQGALAPGAAPLPYVGVQANDNLHMLNDVTNATRDIDITAGRVRDDSDVTNMHLAGTMVKRLDTAWASGGAVGTPVGGCDTGSKGANQTWHLFVIGKLNAAITSYSRTGNVATIAVANHGAGVGGTVRVSGVGSGIDAIAVITSVTAGTISYSNTGAYIGTTSVTAVADVFDVLASQSYAAPTLPTGGWGVKQCLGSVLTDGSANIRAFLQVGDRFMYATPVVETVGSVPGTPTNFAITVPNGVRTFATIQAYNNGDGSVVAGFRIYSPEATDLTLSAYDGSSSFGFYDIGSAQPRVGSTVYDVPTNTSAQVRAAVLASSAFGMRTIGYRDPRRRLF